MNQQYIVDNFRKFKKVDLTASWSSILDNCLETFFASLLQTYSQDLTTFVDVSEFEVFTVFDVFHESDECCELHVLVHKGKAVGIVYKFGDRTDWDSEIFDKEAYLALARDLLTKVMEKKLADSAQTSHFKSLRELKNGYLYFIGADETCFIVLNPRSAGAFTRLGDSHRIFYPTDDGRILQVTSFKDWVVPYTERSRSDEYYQIVVEMEGVESTIDARRLVFELVPGEANLDDVLKAFPKRHLWMVDLATEHNNCCYVLTMQPNHWQLSMLTVQFESAPEFQRFLRQFELKKDYKGPFSLETLGYAGKVLSID